ncbi:MAG: hypothetical protein ACE5FN_07070 [Leptospirillia bacterium]
MAGADGVLTAASAAPRQESSQSPSDAKAGQTPRQAYAEVLGKLVESHTGRSLKVPGKEASPPVLKLIKGKEVSPPARDRTADPAKPAAPAQLKHRAPEPTPPEILTETPVSMPVIPDAPVARATEAAPLSVPVEIEAAPAQARTLDVPEPVEVCIPLPEPVEARTLDVPEPVEARTLDVPEPVEARTLDVPEPVEARTLDVPEPVEARIPAPEPVEARTSAPAPTPAVEALPEEDTEDKTAAYSLGASLIFLSLFAVGFAGWWTRETSYLTPETGAGYNLGIIGAVMMLTLVLYPMRKKARFMRNVGSIKTWFQAHMIKGVVGPLCILFHANFQLGSTNSNVALFAMLLVAASGLVGRFIYTSVHHGLYGSRVGMQEMRDGARCARGELVKHFAFAPQLKSKLQRVETAALAPRGLIGHTVRLFTLGFSLRWTRFRLMRFIETAIASRGVQKGWGSEAMDGERREAKRFLNDYIDSVRTVARFSVYERIFSLWHMLHLPLFILLIIAGVVHVVAVHLY